MLLSAVYANIWIFSPQNTCISVQCPAFHGAFGDFIAWAVRHRAEDPEDDPHKLEVAELKKGLTYLQVHLYYCNGNSALCVE